MVSSPALVKFWAAIEDSREVDLRDPESCLNVAEAGVLTQLRAKAILEEHEIYRSLRMGMACGRIARGER